MAARVFLRLAMFVVLAGIAASPARADGVIQSLFNTNHDNGAKPLFLNRASGAGTSAGADAKPHTFNMNGNGSTGHSRPSVADSFAATRKKNEAANNANVARSAQNAANHAAELKAEKKRATAARLAASAAQRKDAATRQAQAANAAKAAANQSAIANAPVGAMSTPSAQQPAEAPLYNTPGQANTGHAPIFNVR